VAKRSELRDLAGGFALLSDPTRLGILKRLKAGPKNVTALCGALDVKQPTLSHHLGILRMGRLVVGDAASMKALAVNLAKLTPRK